MRDKRVVDDGAIEPARRIASMNRSVLLVGAGVVTIVIGFAKPIEPLIEVGVALVVMAMISSPKPKQ